MSKMADIILLLAAVLPGVALATWCCLTFDVAQGTTVTQSVTLSGSKCSVTVLHIRPSSGTGSMAAITSKLPYWS